MACAKVHSVYPRVPVDEFPVLGLSPGGPLYGHPRDDGHHARAAERSAIPAMMDTPLAADIRPPVDGHLARAKSSAGILIDGREPVLAAKRRDDGHHVLAAGSSARELSTARPAQS